jgi:hypothetical protein
MDALEMIARLKGSGIDPDNGSAFILASPTTVMMLGRHVEGFAWCWCQPAIERTPHLDHTDMTVHHKEAAAQ